MAGEVCRGELCKGDDCSTGCCPESGSSMAVGSGLGAEGVLGAKARLGDRCSGTGGAGGAADAWLICVNGAGDEAIWCCWSVSWTRLAMGLDRLLREPRPPPPDGWGWRIPDGGPPPAPD